MKRFSPPTRQMPSRSMTSSLPTKSRFMGVRISWTSRVVMRVGEPGEPEEPGAGAAMELVAGGVMRRGGEVQGQARVRPPSEVNLIGRPGWGPVRGGGPGPPAAGGPRGDPADGNNRWMPTADRHRGGGALGA